MFLMLPFFFVKRKEFCILVTDKIVLWNTDYGKIVSNLKLVMEKRNISIYQLCRLTGLKFEVIKKYYDNTITRYDSDVVAKFCFVLECDISDIISYIPKNKV